MGGSGVRGQSDLKILSLEDTRVYLFILPSVCYFGHILVILALDYLPAVPAPFLLSLCLFSLSPSLLPTPVPALCPVHSATSLPGAPLPDLLPALLLHPGHQYDLRTASWLVLAVSLLVSSFLRTGVLCPAFSWMVTCHSKFLHFMDPIYQSHEVPVPWGLLALVLGECFSWGKTNHSAHCHLPTATCPWGHLSLGYLLSGLDCPGRGRF